MLFVDNVKAGSATVRKRLKEVWGITWETWESDMKDRRARCGRGRTTTACVTEAQANATLRWAVVRDPVAKLESGVRQIWERPGWNRFLSADELLRKQLALNVGKFVDEHFEPNAWRLSGRLKDGRALRLDYVLKLEELDEPGRSWPRSSCGGRAGVGKKRSRRSPRRSLTGATTTTRSTARRTSRRGSRRRWSRACATHRTSPTSGRASTIRGRRCVGIKASAVFCAAGGYTRGDDGAFWRALKRRRALTARSCRRGLGSSRRRRAISSCS